MPSDNLKSKIESLLFVSSGPLKTGKIARSLNVPKDKVVREIDCLEQEYRNRNAGICLIRSGDTVEMGTRPDNFPEVEKFLSKVIKEELTPAAIEALSIIAYRGPVSEEEVSTIRGVNSQIIISHLLRRGFVIEEGNPPKYEVSTKFLRQLGIESVRNLPHYEKYHQIEISEENEVQSSGT